MGKGEFWGVLNLSEGTLFPIQEDTCGAVITIHVVNLCNRVTL